VIMLHYANRPTANHDLEAAMLEDSRCWPAFCEGQSLSRQNVSS
jgi:hypothetical protein